MYRIKRKAKTIIVFIHTQKSIIRRKILHDNQKQHNDGGIAHILIGISGNPGYHFGKELISEYTLCNLCN